MEDILKELSFLILELVKKFKWIIKVSKVEKIIALIVLILAFAGMVISRIDMTFYEAVFVREDIIIEWLTVLALLAVTYLCFYRVVILRKSKAPLFLIATLVLGLLFVFGAGEEISWGQRLLGIKSPEFFMKHNTQYEMNFHNLMLNGVRINKLIFGLLLTIIILFYFLVLPVLFRKIEKIRNLANSLALPIPRVSHVFLYLVLGGIVLLIPSSKKGEILEFGGCWIFFIMILNPFNKSNFFKA